MPGQAERAAEPDRADEREHHDGDGGGDRHPAEAGDVDEAELQPEQHDADAQQGARGDAEARGEHAGERLAQRRDLADDDAERDGGGQQRHRGHGEVHQPREQRRRCRDEKARHDHPQLGNQKCSWRNVGVSGTPVQSG